MVTERSRVALGAVVLLSLLATSALPQSATTPPPRVGLLFSRHCAGCHGSTGAADTAIAALLSPRPRAFTDGLFHLVSTQNGLPVREDIVHSLQHGMPGSTMLAFEWLPEGDLQALADHVLALAFPSRTVPPAPRIEPAHAFSTDRTTLAAGERLYLRHCAACHGIDGRGCEPPPDWVGNADYSWPRDFTQGFLRGGGDVGALTRRVLAGMPGSRMPPVLLSDEEAARVVAFVHSLIPEGAAEHHAQWRRHLTAVRTEALPDGPDAAAWDAIEAVRLPTAPLRWRRDGVFEVFVRAAHDGERLAVQLQWADATRNDRALDGSRFADGAAVQLTAAMDAPLIAMGSDNAPVDIWHWKAFRPENIAGALDLLDSQRASGVQGPLPGLTCPARRGEAVVVHGAGSMPQQRGGGRGFSVQAEWRDGRWTVVMTRALRAQGNGELALHPGDTLSFALAIWNGSIDTSPASKAITNWHELELQR